MIKIQLTGIINVKAQADRLIELKRRLPEEILKISNRFGLRVVRTSQKDYLSGPRPQKLGVGRGHLRASIRFKTERKNKSVDVVIGTDVPYARIHEEGGQTGPRMILPRKAKALRFTVGGKVIFAKRANHPGSTIKARPFLAPAVKDNMDSLKEDLNGILSRIYGKQQ